MINIIAYSVVGLFVVGLPLTWFIWKLQQIKGENK